MLWNQNYIVAQIDSSLLGTSIIIRTIAGDKLQVDKFTLSDARKMKALIENKQTEIANPLTNYSIVDEIIKLNELLQNGIISISGFNKIKKQII